MGFSLWIERDVAWAAGTYEYRPFGAAVISNTDLFRPRDFRRDCVPPLLTADSFVGYFASLGDVNHHLLSRREELRKVRSRRFWRG